MGAGVDAEAERLVLGDQNAGTLIQSGGTMRLGGFSGLVLGATSTSTGVYEIRDGSLTADRR